MQWANPIGAETPVTLESLPVGCSGCCFLAVTTQRAGLLTLDSLAVDELPGMGEILLIPGLPARIVDKNIYIIQGEINTVVGAIKRSARWSTHTHLDEERDPLLHSFSILKEVLNNITVT
ncbi:hypothetical protein lerEdw1_013328 [Lerista edwardsae]|nr:hypothetical protein lerEdw1_013328 [Lerista edwardsae]